MPPASLANAQATNMSYKRSPNICYEYMERTVGYVRVCYKEDTVLNIQLPVMLTPMPPKVLTNFSNNEGAGYPPQWLTFLTCSWTTNLL